MIIYLNYNRNNNRSYHIDNLKTRSIILGNEDSDRLRKLFIDNFVNSNSEYYKLNILKKEKGGGNIYYQGYLWDSLLNYHRVKKESDLDFLDKLKDNEVYVMSDLHSKERLGNDESLLPFFPNKNILQAKLEDVLSSLAALSQDSYIFDKSFSWYLILTHESDESGPEIYFEKEADREKGTELK